MRTHFSNNLVSFGTLTRLCGGELHQGKLGAVSAKYICTDSREADSETVFVALRGERADGHDYIHEALSRGCRCVICEHSNEEIQSSGATAIVVNDTELALSKLANGYYSQYLRCKKIAVTGSVGKTTTKGMLASVFATRNATYCTPGNYNSLIGMPMSMLEIPVDTKWAVLEMGMSNFGEIERLSIASEPDIAVITNIGTSHMETLGSRENICRAKLEVLCGLQNGGTLILNGDEPLLRRVHGKSYRTVYVSIQNEKADFYAKNINVDVGRTTFDIVWKDGICKDLSVHVMGSHNAYAALYAFAAATLAGVEPEMIRAGLEAYRPEIMRQNMYDVKGVTVIEDCYNASPESMNAAVNVLEEFSRRTGRRSIAVLGDMLELGNDSPALHRMVGYHVAEKKIDKLFTVGRGGDQIAVGARQRGMSQNQIVQNSDSGALTVTGEALMKEVREGDVILFKASRAVGAEQIISYLKEHL